jgi:hypothetical protein
MNPEPRNAIDACVAFATGVLHLAIERATERRGRAFDPVRSLYVSDLDAFEILESGAKADGLVAPDGILCDVLPGPLRFLSAFERATIALLAGVAVIPRADRIVGFLHDDLTRRSVTSGLLLDLFSRGLDERARAYRELGGDGLLARLGMIRSAGDEASGQRVELDQGFFGRLCGSSDLDRRLLPFAERFEPRSGDAPCDLSPIARTPTVLWGGSADAIAAAARDCAAARRLTLLRISADAPSEIAGIAAREALFDGALLSFATTSPAGALQIARSLTDLPVLAFIEAPSGITALDGFAQHRVSDGLRRVEQASVAQPLPYGRRIVARRGMDRIVLPADKLRALRSIAARIEHRQTVIERWGVETGSSAGGVRCLFSGPPGTGKTLAAEAIAAGLHRDLYAIDVSAVVSKYIGETEKILAQVFTEAARAKVLLFFDEADALFGKRGEQKDAHDKYANIETAYLLQAIDAYPDLVVLATNMRNNIDDALSRRIDVFVEFPMPDAQARRKLWIAALANAPYDPADIAHLAHRFAISGGSIQNAALAAAYEAAAESRSITLMDLLRAARDELAKSGKVAGRVELGDHYDALMAES